MMLEFVKPSLGVVHPEIIAAVKSPSCQLKPTNWPSYLSPEHASIPGLVNIHSLLKLQFIGL